MKRFAILLFIGALLPVAAFGCSDGNETTAGTAGAGGGGGGAGGAGGDGGTGGTMAKPEPGALLERMGRPAINTALNHPFDPDKDQKGQAKDKWNTEEPETWAMNHQAEVEENLAILDGVDTTCGNQFIAGPNAVEGRYAGLAGALVDDRLWIKTDAMTCSQYLAVEADATKVVPNMDCGGRTLAYDVVDTSYSVLATGMLTGVVDGIDPPGNVGGTTFPYLAPPN